ncbi:MAG TPA: patatin-like phospholipase family protein, partial [Anaerolineales bacterium]|nr:patatin-like phospholipase family protein [Anaerolineales bacterium]
NEELPDSTVAQFFAEHGDPPADIQPGSLDEVESIPMVEENQPVEEDKPQSTDVPNLVNEVDQPIEDNQPVSADGMDSISTPLADQPGLDEDLQDANETVTLPSEPAILLPQFPTSPFSTEFLPIPTPEDAPQETNPRKVALILSGGGARGAFQVGAEKYAREVKGYQWDIIAGVSVGALNGAMLAMHRYGRLLELWDSLSDREVYTGGFNLVSLVKIILGAKSFYGNKPLQTMMEHEFEAGRILDDLRVGTVSLISGEYLQFTKESLELSKAILASASIPVVWPPVDVSADHPAMVDGGVRNITPIGDVLELEPDEIVIINCGNPHTPTSLNAAANVLSIGMRALDIMQNEIFTNDMKQFLRINALVHEAELHGCTLHHPKTGKPYKYYPYQVIEPDSELGEVLDFSQKSIQASIKAGVRRARQVLGRP